jgi:hypothetical protein
VQGAAHAVDAEGEDDQRHPPEDWVDEPVVDATSLRRGTPRTLHVEDVCVLYFADYKSF